MPWSRIFYVADMPFKPIRVIKILRKISKFSRVGTSFVQTLGELYIHGKSEVPSEPACLLCVVEIVW